MHDARAPEKLGPFAVPTSLSLLALTAAITLACAPHRARAQDAAANVDHGRGVVSANEAAIVRAEVLHTIEKYYEYFSTGQMERIPRETHLLPWIFLGTGEATATAEETARGYVERRQMVLDDFDPDYEKSTYTATGVCVLSRTAAITSGYNTRTTSDGGVVSVEGVSYILTKAPQGWRIAAFSETTPNKVISCEDR